MHKASWGNWYWPIVLAIIFVLIVPAETFALITNVANSLSDWVWRTFDIVRAQPVSQWTASRFLFVVEWLAFFGWLTFHFCLRLFV